MDEEIDPQDVLEQMSERGRLEWELGVQRLLVQRLQRRVAELENAQQPGAATDPTQGGDGG